MADIITVDDPDDPRLSDYTGLTDVELRRRREPAEGLFIAEGEKVIRRAGQAGYAMRSMLLSAKWVEVMGDVIEAATAPVYVVDPALAERVTGYHVHRGALASMARKPLPTATELLARPGTRRIALLEGIVDHGNLGTIYRSAAALGIEAVLLSADCADPLYRRSVKTSMGAVFTIPYARLAPGRHALEVVREADFKLLALTPDEKATALGELRSEPDDQLALMLGSEGHGLSQDWMCAADEWVRIPMSHGVDSLNIAAAAAISFYSLCDA
ncbi:RNA methyltransferase [Streptomyces rimosus]|uniref:TrmH family RNA methyltransferase n=1 Tax=Streptomyces rimosus TaxID=1927 RepID=UPI0005197AB8|nr:RNA methyltransferase [Streptomyces rimosus]